MAGTRRFTALHALGLTLLLGVPALAADSAPPPVLSGLDVLVEHGFSELRGLRVGLISNQTGRDRKGRTSVQIFANASGMTLSALFSPEHGFAGVSEDSSVVSGIFALPDGRTIPLYSLYGATRTPTAEMLSGLDALVFDIQDAGARFYTYSTTMALSLEAAARAGIDYVVLDRPNPVNGDSLEGPVLEEGLRSFISYLRVPVRHGFTMGELARLHNLGAGLGAKLTILPLKGWRRSMWYDQTGLPWTRPSPNLPDLASAALYPGLACFEPFNVSVGRGTPMPFRWVGAPWLDAAAALKRLKAAGLPGVEFSLAAFTPEKDIFKGVACPGVRVNVIDRDAARPLRVFAHMAAVLRDLHPGPLKVDYERLTRMVGSRRFVELYKAGAPAAELEAALSAGLDEFRARRAAFLLY
ncbi:MAG: DUF1343 domain-containing protein [Elusimicrobia bacterium]|nr:DUF1343 domain-containing protein [Elusimicrobiota bacterium]